MVVRHFQLRDDRAQHHAFCLGRWRGPSVRIQARYYMLALNTELRSSIQQWLRD